EGAGSEGRTSYVGRPWPTRRVAGPGPLIASATGLLLPHRPFALLDQPADRLTALATDLFVELGAMPLRRDPPPPPACLPHRPPAGAARAALISPARSHRVVPPRRWSPRLPA